MTAKHHRNDPRFFAKCKNWVIAKGGRVSDGLYERRPGESTRGLVIEPPGTAQATALFLHGTGNDLTYPAVDLYKHLFRQRIRVCAFDLDGHGSRGTSLLSAEGIRDFTDWSVSSLPGPKEHLFIIGHSLGGTLALDFAARHPHSLAGLILLSAPLRLNANLKSLIAESASVLRNAVWQETRTYGPWGILPALGPFKRRDYPVRLAHPERDYVNTVGSLISELQLAGRLGNVKTPVLLIYGSGDLIVPVSNAEELEEKLAHPMSVVVPGATHFSTILEHGVAEAVATFISKHAVPEK